MTTDLQMCYELGQQAAMMGESIDSCSFRNQNKYAHWLRGFNDFQKNHNESVLLSEKQRDYGLEKVTQLKKLLKKNAI